MRKLDAGHLRGVYGGGGATQQEIIVSLWETPNVLTRKTVALYLIDRAIEVI